MFQSIKIYISQCCNSIFILDVEIVDGVDVVEIEIFLIELGWTIGGGIVDYYCFVVGVVLGEDGV